MKRFTVSLILSLLLLFNVGSAAAHGYIVRAVPEDRAVLDRSPTRVQYWFSESLEPDFSSLNVRDQSGAIIASGGVAEENPTLLRAMLPSNLPDGAYVVELRPAFASDGHVYAESRVFFVGQEVGEIAGQAATDQAVPLEVVWRALTLAATMLAFGVCTLYALVLVPAWGNRTFRAGLLPPRLMTHLNWIFGAALVAALLGNLLALLQQAMVFFGVSASDVLTQGLWNVVRIGSRFGDIWNFRMMLLALVGAIFAASIYYRNTNPATVRPFWHANMWGLALVVGSFSAVSHAAGSLLWPWIAIAFDWLHGIGAGLWVGGLMALILVLPAALKPYSGDERRAALSAALRRFSRLAVACVGLVITTGVYSSLNWITTPDDMTRTTFGGTLVFKVLLVAGLLVLGAANHIALRPERYVRWSHLIGRWSDAALRLRLEVVIALIVLAWAGLLTATAVPVPDFTRQQAPVPSASQTVGDLTVTITLSPGGPGVNTADVMLTRDGGQLDAAQVWVQQIDASRDRRGHWLPADPTDDGIYVASDDAIDQPGKWWTVIDIQTADDEYQRAAFAWDISQDAAVIESRPPSLLNIVALAAVMLAIGAALYPAAARLIHQLDLSPVTIMVSIGAVIVTVVFLIFGSWVVKDSDRRYWETTNPPPKIVNAALPDADSLARGQTLYVQFCLGWDDNASLDELRLRLPRTRDEELFQIIAEGWRGLPPCAVSDDTISDAQRWNLVNYIRTFERGRSL